MSYGNTPPALYPTQKEPKWEDLYEANGLSSQNKEKARCECLNVVDINDKSQCEEAMSSAYMGEQKAEREGRRSRSSATGSESYATMPSVQSNQYGSIPQ